MKKFIVSEDFVLILLKQTLCMYYKMAAYSNRSAS